MNSPLTTQVGGNHYKTGGIQPIEFAHQNNYDPAAFSVLKYVTRHRRKAGRQDLEKAFHFALIREEMLSKYGSTFQPTYRVPMSVYCQSNSLTDADAWALLQLETWVQHRVPGPNSLMAAIRVIMAEYDGTDGAVVFPIASS